MASIIHVLIVHLVLPFGFVCNLWFAKPNEKLDWLLNVSVTGLLVAWCYQCGSWDWVGYPLRYVLVLLFLIASLWSWKRVKASPFRVPGGKGKIFSRGIHVLLIVVFGLYNVSALTGYAANGKGIDLVFPLQDGTYYVAHGGNSVMLNYHNAYESQQYALDIVKLNRFGLRAGGLYPKDLEKYSIYGDILYSPCSGMVLEVQDGLDDLPPPHTDPGNPAGNHIILQCDGTDAEIHIAHMQKQSIRVEPGQHVRVGEEIGRAGNSGNTTEPHLHIHAEINGAGIPITFDGKFLIRNQLWKAQ